MASRHQETLKKINAGLSEEQRLNELMLKKLYQSVLSGNKVQAGIITKAIKIIFPKKTDAIVADVVFKALWKLGKHRQAIRIYIKAGKLFWHTGAIGRHYEKQGLMSKAVEEWEYLMNTYSKMGKKGILPLPNGPPELYKLGRWYADKDKAKSRRYLKLYLSDEDRRGPSCFLWHKNAAKKLLNSLKGP